MVFLANVPWYSTLLNLLVLITGILLILLILIQRGKGGGLVGAFGGVGGSSAFGTRAGDQFTRLTIYVAAVWVLLIMIMVKLVNPTSTKSDSKPAGTPAPSAGSTQLWHPEQPSGRDA